MADSVCLSQLGDRVAANVSGSEAPKVDSLRNASTRAPAPDAAAVEVGQNCGPINRELVQQRCRIGASEIPGNEGIDLRWCQAMLLLAAWATVRTLNGTLRGSGLEERMEASQTNSAEAVEQDPRTPALLTWAVVVRKRSLKAHPDVFTFRPV